MSACVTSTRDCVNSCLFSFPCSGVVEYRDPAATTWVEYAAEAYGGRKYFFNPYTQETVWDAVPPPSAMAATPCAISLDLSKIVILILNFPHLTERRMVLIGVLAYAHRCGFTAQPGATGAWCGARGVSRITNKGVPRPLSPQAPKVEVPVVKFCCTVQRVTNHSTGQSGTEVCACAGGPSSKRSARSKSEDFSNKWHSVLCIISALFSRHRPAKDAYFCSDGPFLALGVGEAFERDHQLPPSLCSFSSSRPPTCSSSRSASLRPRPPASPSPSPELWAGQRLPHRRRSHPGGRSSSSLLFPSISVCEMSVAWCLILGGSPRTTLQLAIWLWRLDEGVEPLRCISPPPSYRPALQWAWDILSDVKRGLEQVLNP